MADAETPQFRTYSEGESISPVDPEDLKRFWKLKPPSGSGNNVQSACGSGADTATLYRRWCMIQTLITYKLLIPWQHGDDRDDAIIGIAATFPIREHKQKSYMIPGDEMFGFDPNAFVERLIEETGVSHVWEPVATRIPEGGRTIVTASANFTG